MSRKTAHQKWIEILNGCHAQRRFKQWSIGDALNDAKQNWSNQWGRKKDLWQEASDATGCPIDSLFQYARVASVFPAKQRIRGVSFSSYQAIAGLASEKKRRWLVNKTATDELTCEQVRLIVQKLQNNKTVGKKKLTVEITVDAYRKLRDQAISQRTTVKKLAVKTLSNLSEERCLHP
jgi:hypothetical protein